MHLTRVTVAPSFAPLSCGALWKSWASVSGEFNKLRARESKRAAVDFCVLIWFLRGNPLKTDHLSLKRFIFSIGGVNFPWKRCYSVASRNILYVRLICFMYLFSLNTVQKVTRHLTNEDILLLIETSKRIIDIIFIPSVRTGKL